MNINVHDVCETRKDFDFAKRAPDPTILSNSESRDVANYFQSRFQDSNYAQLGFTVLVLFSRYLLFSVD